MPQTKRSWRNLFASTLRHQAGRVFLAIWRHVLSTPVIFYTRAGARVLRTRVCGSKRLAVGLMLGLALTASLGFSILRPAPTDAANADTINFQARLEGRDGAIVEDGNYNVEFKLYNTASGGSPLWTEDDSYVDSTHDYRIKVVNGYLTVNLGAVASFPSTIPWDQDLYVTMNIGGTGTSPSWDGEMNPRLKLTAVPYAFQAQNATQLQVSNGSNLATLSFTAPTTTDSIVLPDASGTVCLANSSACGFAGSSGSGNYIQNGSSLQAGANFDIQSVGVGTATGVIEALTGQTADLLQFDNSSAAAMSGINASGELYYQSGSYTGTLVQDSLGQSTTYYLPDPKGAQATICLSTGNCAGSGGGITGSGNPDYLAVFNTSSTLNASTQLYDDGSFVGVGSTTDDGKLTVVSSNASQAGAFVQSAANATAPTLLVKGGATPGTGADLADFETSAGTVVASVDASGNLAAGTATFSGNLLAAGSAVVLGTTDANFGGGAGVTAGSISFGNASNGQLQIITSEVPTGTGNVQYDLPSGQGGQTYELCTTIGNCAGSGAGATANGGVTNYIAKFSAAQAITSSDLYDDGNFVGLNTTTNSGLLSLQGASATQSTIYATAAGASSVPTVVLQTAANQTGDLIDFEDPSTTVVAKVDANGNLTAANGTFTGTLGVSGNTSLSGTLGVTKTATIGTGLTVTSGGATITAGGLTVTAGATSLGGTLAVTGASTLTGLLTANGGATIIGATAINTTGSAATTIGNSGSSTTIGGTLSVSGESTFNGTVDVSGTNALTVGTGTVTLGSLGAGLVQASSGGVLSSSAVDRNSSAFFSGELSVANGGTGADTFTANGIIYGNGTSALQVTASADDSVLITGDDGTPSLSQTLPAAVQGNITQTGALAGGSIASGFGTISTGSDIKTTAGLQGGTLSVAAGTFAVNASGNVTYVGSTTAGGTLVCQNADGQLATCSDSYETTGGTDFIQNTTTQQTGANIDIKARTSSVAATIQGAVGQDIADFVSSAGGTPVASIDASGNLTAANLSGVDASLSGTLSVTSTSTFTGLATFNGGLTDSGTVTLGGDTSVTGSHTFTVGTGATSLGGTLTVTGLSTFNGNVGISGANTLTVGTGATTLGGTLAVTGTSTLTGLLTANGGATVKGVTAINTTGNATTTIGGSSSATTIGGALTISGDTTESGGLTIQGSAGETLGSTTAPGLVNFLDGTDDGFASVLNTTTLTAGRTISLPDASGTVCLENSSACGFQTTTSAAADFVQGGNRFGATAILGTNDDNPLELEADGTVGLTVLQGGNVGIGTTNPGAALQVNGSSTVHTGTGTISSSGATVTGTGTAFTTQLQVGDVIIAAGQSQIITSISSDTSLSTTDGGDFSPALSGASFTYTQPAESITHQDNQLGLFISTTGSTGTPLFVQSGSNYLFYITSSGAVVAEGSYQSNDGIFTSGNNHSALFESGSPAAGSNSYPVYLQSANTSSGASSGNVSVDAGSVSGGTAGMVNIGTSNASGLNLGHVGTTTTIGGALTVSSFGAGVLQSDSNGAVSSSDLNLASGPVTGTLGLGNGGTGASTAAGARTNLGAAASGANSDITSLSAVTSIGNTAAGLTVGSSAQPLTLQGSAASVFTATSGSYTTTLGFGTPTANVTYDFPTAAAGIYDICTSVGNCTASGPAGGDLSGNYPDPTIAKLQGTTVTISSLASGDILQYNGTKWVNQAISGDITIDGTGVATIGAHKVTNGDLVNDALGVTAGTGLTGGGSVALGDSTTLNLATTGVPAGDYGSAADVAKFTVNAEGQLTAASSVPIAIATSQISSGNYVASLGALTGLTTTDNSGTASTPTLAVVYGSATLTAAEGNTALSFTGSGNLTGTVSGTAGGGFTTNTLAVVNNPTFSGLVTANGGLSVATATTFTNAGATLNTALAIVNLPTGGSIGTAATTVDVATTFDIDQTTANQSVTIPSPTTTTSGRRITIDNVGTASFTIGSITVPNSESRDFLWNGSAWVITSTTLAGTGLTQTGNTITSAAATSVSNDTNIQGSIAGNVLDLSWAGTLSVARGGTGATTFTSNGILYGNGTGALQVTGAAANSILATNGSNVPSLTQTLPSAVQGNITTLGTVSESNNFTTSGTIQGNIVNVTGAGAALELNGADINTAGTLSNVAYLDAATQTFTGTNTFSGAGTALKVTNSASVGGTLTVGSSTLTNTALSFSGAGSITSASGSNLTIDTGGGTSTLNLGTTHATTVNVGRSSITTNVTGSNISLSGNTSIAAGNTFTVSSGQALITGQNSGSANTLTVNNHTSTGNPLVVESGDAAVFTVANGGNITATKNVAIQGSGGLTLGSTSVTGVLSFLDGTSDGYTGTLKLTGALSSNQTYYLPAAGGTLCTTDTCTSGGGSVNGGTANYVARFTGTTTLGTGVLYDNGVGVSVGGTSPAGLFNVGSSNQFQISSAGAVLGGTYNGQTITSAANFTGTVTVATGETITSGGLTVTAGGLAVTAGATSLGGTLAVTGAATFSSTINSDTLTSTGLQFGGANATISAGSVIVDTTGAGSVELGATHATTVAIGSTSGSTAQSINIGTNSSAAETITQGSSNTGTTVELQGGANYVDVTNTGVGINTTTPAAALDVNGATSRGYNGTQRVYQNVFGYSDNNNPDTGTFVIVMPKGWSNTMMSMTINGYEFAGNKGAWQVVIGGYNYESTPAWSDTSAQISGNAPFSSVRLGYDGTHMIVMLGTTTTTWHYPKISVDEFTAGYSGVDGWGSGWSGSFVTDESSYTNVVTPALNQVAYTGNTVALQGSTPGTAQTGNFNISGTGIAGTLQAGVIKATGTGTALTVTNNASIGGTLSVGTSATIGNGLTVTAGGATITAGGLTVSAGLATLSGGLTATGATAINTTGTASTSIGNATGTFSLSSSGLQVTTAGALSGITTLGLSGAISGATSGDTINGLVINGGALSGVTGISSSGGYTQTGSAANTFTGATTLGGTLTLDSLGTAGNDTALCYNSSKEISGCSDSFETTGGTDFIQNGVGLQSSANFFIQGVASSVTAKLEGATGGGDILDLYAAGNTTTPVASFDANGNLTAAKGTFSNGLTVTGTSGNNIASFYTQSGEAFYIDQSGDAFSNDSIIVHSYTNGGDTDGFYAGVTDASSSGSNTVDANEVALSGHTTSGTNTLNGLALDDVTAIANNTFNGIYAGTGYNSILNYNGTSLINGSGILQNAALSSSIQYTNITGVGALTSGSIGNGFGIIATTNNITTTAAVQGGTFKNTASSFAVDGSGNLTAVQGNFNGDVAVAGGHNVYLEGSTDLVVGVSNNPYYTQALVVSYYPDETALTLADDNGQTGSLLQFLDYQGNVESAFGANGQLTLGTIATSGTVHQGQLSFGDGTTDGFTTTLQTDTQANNLTLSVPADTHTTDTICLEQRDNCAAVNGVSGTGNNNYVARFTGTSTLGTGVLYDNGTGVSVGGTSPAGLFNVGSSNQFQVSSTGAVLGGTYNGQTITSSANFTGTLTVATGETITSGGLTVTAGGLTVAAGGASITGTASINTTGTSGTTIGNTNSATTIGGSLTLSALGAGAVQSNSAGLLSASTLSVGNGGTGATSFTANELLLGNGTGAIQSLATADNGVLVTNASGVPSISSTLPTAVQGNITTLGTVSESNNFTTSGTIQGNVVNVTGAGAALELNGLNINTAGTLSNVAYLSQANTFTSANNTFSAVGTGLSVTHNASVGGTLTIGGTSTLTSTALSFGGAGNISSSSGNNLTIDTGGGTSTLNLGTTNATTINLGRSSATTNVTGGNINLTGNTNVAAGDTFTVSSGQALITGQNSGGATTLTVNNHTSGGSPLVVESSDRAVFTIANGGNVTATGSMAIQGSGGLTLGTTGSGGVAGELNLTNGSNGYVSSLTAAAPSGANQTFTLPATGGTLCTTTTCQASGSYETTTGTDFIRNQATQQTGAEFNIQAASGDVAAKIQGAASQDIVDFYGSGSSTTPLAKIDSSGNLTAVGGTFSGNVSVTGTYNGNTFTSSALAFSGASANTITGASGQNLSIDTGGASTLNLGAANATTVNLGGGTAAETLNIGNSSGADTINLGTNTAAGDTITAGSSNSSTTVKLQGGASYLDVTNAGVGIGTTTPASALDVNGAISRGYTSGAGRVYQNVYDYWSGANPATGTFVIVMPNGWTNTMMTIELSGYNYLSGTGAWQAVVSGYNYSGTDSWYNYSAQISGNAPFSSIRLGYDGTHVVLMLGTTTTAWHYPAIDVDQFAANDASSNAWGSGWSGSFVTDESAYSAIVTPTVNQTAYTNNTVALQGSTPGTAQTGNFNISGTGIAGTLQAKTVNASGTGAALELNGVNINTAGTLSNVAYLSQANTFIAANTFSASGTALSVTHNAAIGGTLTVTGLTTLNGGLTVGGEPTGTSTASLFQLGANAIASGNNDTDGGTYLGVNEPSSGAGSTADFLELENNGFTEAEVRHDGSAFFNGYVSSNSNIVSTYGNIYTYYDAVEAGSATSDPAEIGDLGPSDQSALELGGDTTLYRSAAGVLTTDGALQVQGSGGLTLGTPSSIAGTLNLANASNSQLATLQAQAPSGSGNATYLLPSEPGGTTDTICMSTLRNCTALGGAAGDLTGSYPDPTIAKLQGTTLTLSSLTTGDVLQYNGSAVVNAHLTNTNLTAGTFANITGTGALNAGSIASGFGTISTGNTITTTAGVQGGSFSNTNSSFTVNSSGNVKLALASSGTSLVCQNASNQLSTCNSSYETTTGNDFVKNGTNTQTANFNIQSAATTSVAATIQGTTNQSADLLDIQNSGATMSDKFAYDGSFNVQNSGSYTLAVNNTAQTVGVGAAATASKLYVTTSSLVGAAINQTSSNDILDLQNSGSTVAKFDSSGNLTAVGGTFSGAVSAGTGLTVTSGGATITAGGVTVSAGGLSVTGASTFAGNVSISGSSTLTVGTGATSLGGTLTVSKKATLSATGGIALAVTGAPQGLASNSLVQLGNAISGGNSSGTYLGVNEPSSGAGSSADFLNFEHNGTSELKVTSGGAVTVAGQLTANAGVTVSGAVTASTTVNAGTAYLYNNSVGTVGEYLRSNGTTGFVASGLQGSDGAGVFIQNVPSATSDNTILPTAAGVVGLTVKGTSSSTTADVLDIYNAGSGQILQDYFDASGSLHVAQIIQPTTNNNIDIGTSSDTFRTGYFGTSVTAGGTTLNSNSLSFTGSGTISTASSGTLELQTGSATETMTSSGGFVLQGSSNTSPLLTLNSSTGTATLEVRTGAATSYNTFVGLSSGGSNTGLANTALGATALQYNTSGDYSTAIGMSALLNNSTGSENTAVGGLSLETNSSGQYNTAVGVSSLVANSTGSYNTALGYGALLGVRTGSGDTAIGTGADVSGSSGTLANATAIGYQAEATASNSLVLGSINGVNGATSSTNVGIGTTAPSALLSVGASSAFQVDNSGNITTAGTMTINGTGNSFIAGALGLGAGLGSTVSPQAGSAITIQNASWISALNAAGNGYLNLFEPNANNEIQVGAALDTDGGIELPLDAGAVTIVDMPFDGSQSAGTANSYTFRIGSTNALSVYGENDGSGNAQNVRVEVGSSITPAYTFEVDGNTSGYVAEINNASSAASTSIASSSGGLLINLNVADGSRQTGNEYVAFGAQGTVDGRIYGNGGRVVYGTSGADYAEYFAANPSNLPQSGELVSLNGTDSVSQSQNTPPMGIISTTAGFVGNGPICQSGDANCNTDYNESNVLVALSGQVPAKVTVANGAINVGDPITASPAAGVGEKATTAGQIVGYALTGTNTDGTIQVLVQPGYYDPGNGQNIQGNNAVLNSLTVNGAMNAQSINVGGLATVGSLQVTGSASIGGDLTVGGNLTVSQSASIGNNLSVGGNLTVTGSTSVTDITVNGHIITAGNAPTVAAAVNAGTGAVITVNGNDTAGTITIATGAQTQQVNSSGQTVTLGNNPTTGDMGTITFNKAYGQPPRIIITPNDGKSAPLLIYPDQESSTSFSFALSNLPAPNSTYTFNYFIVQ